MGHAKKSIFPLRQYLEPEKFVTFGRYRVTDQIKDNTPISWLVKDVQEDKALLLSRYGLDVKPYHTELEDVSWETCYLRRWLNGEFLNTAFNEEEQRVILTEEIDNSKAQLSPVWSWGRASNNTYDKVFLLSNAEARRYFHSYRDRKCRATGYAVSRGASISPRNGRSCWWLRTFGSVMYWADVVIFDGTDHFSEVNEKDNLVRPALWIDLTTDLF